MDRILNMVIRQVIRQIVGKGMNAGIGRLTRGRDEGTPAQQAKTRQTSDQAKGAMRLLRRFGRF
jgi:hypothetical protein